ncbi:hypothetical protein DEI82_15130 [Curtobacterium sp. MCBD17_019]|nr:hypothetical protein DEI82_15130 [Curtobacterium sp. MCBD17_019]
MQVAVTTFPRTGPLPPMLMRALPTTLHDAVSLAIAYADDVCGEQQRSDREAVAEAALHGLLHPYPTAEVTVGSLAALHLQARMLRRPSAYDMLARALRRVTRHPQPSMARAADGG